VTRRGAIAALALLLACAGAALSNGAVRADSATHATFIFGGDVLIHTPLWNHAQRTARANGTRGGYDFRPMFDDIRSLVSRADLAVCHLETPIVPRGEALSTFPLFGVPREIIPALADAGFDRCSTASNHTLDRGVAGINATVSELLANGISQTGMARTKAESEPVVFEVKGIRVAHQSYTFSYNGLQTPPGEPWRSALIDPRQIIRDAKRTRALGADVVITSLHWGTERNTTPNSYQLDIAKRLTDSGQIDLIIGHHAHVVQPIDNVNDVWVAYGLSNLLSNLPTDERWPAKSQDGVLVEVTIVKSRGDITVMRPVAHPTWVDKQRGFVIRLAQSAVRDLSLPQNTRGGTRDSLARTAAVLGDFFP
jgi:poly-gamma-glutamate synthesis protein (capsule biosynthesis protein)